MTAVDAFIIIQLKLLVHKYALSTSYCSSEMNKAGPNSRFHRKCNTPDCKCTLHTVHRKREVDTTVLQIRLTRLINFLIYLSLNMHIGLT